MKTPTEDRYAGAAYESWCRRTITEDMEALRAKRGTPDDLEFYRQRIQALRKALDR